MIEFISWLTHFLTSCELKYQKLDAQSVYISKIDQVVRYKRYGDFNAIAEKEILVWEDWWKYKPEVLKSKVKSKLGLLYRIPGRVCTIRRITSPTANQFLEENHLTGSTNSKIKYGLYLPKKYYRLLPFKPEGEEVLIGVMTFSGKRVFKDGSSSYELVRYAVLKDYTVQGGFTKCMSAFIKEKDPDSIMTYADLDWYSDSFYEKLGFEIKGKYPKHYFKVSEEGRRVKVSEKDKAQVKNKGSVKLLWERR